MSRIEGNATRRGIRKLAVETSKSSKNVPVSLTRRFSLTWILRVFSRYLLLSSPFLSPRKVFTAYCAFYVLPLLLSLYFVFVLPFSVPTSFFSNPPAYPLAGIAGAPAEKLFPSYVRLNPLPARCRISVTLFCTLIWRYILPFTPRCLTFYWIVRYSGRVTDSFPLSSFSVIKAIEVVEVS